MKIMDNVFLLILLSSPQKNLELRRFVLFSGYLSSLLAGTNRRQLPTGCYTAAS